MKKPKFTKAIILLTIFISTIVTQINIFAVDNTQRHFSASGTVTDSVGKRLYGAMVSYTLIAKKKSTTVFTNTAGSYHTPSLPTGEYKIRIRKIGFADVISKPENFQNRQSKSFQLRKNETALLTAEQLPANYWRAALDFSASKGLKEHFALQCNFCHQIGSIVTRRQRSKEIWSGVVADMRSRGSKLGQDASELVPQILAEGFDKIRKNPSILGLPPRLSTVAQKSTITEWDLGPWSASHHDLIIAQSGLVYTGDYWSDKLWELNPETDEVKTYDIPHLDGDTLNGWMGDTLMKSKSGAKVYQGPHSLQQAPNGDIWFTLSFSNRLGKFDVNTKKFSFVDVDGYYPHTIRIDSKGRIWFTLAISNEVGFYDPAKKESRIYDLPTRNFKEAFSVWVTPFIFWFSRNIANITGSFSTDRQTTGVPLPYGIDISPDDRYIYFSQLYANRFGYIDSKTGDIKIFDFPATGPRRLRVEKSGLVWITAFGSGEIVRFDPKTQQFKNYMLPVTPLASETPYALNVRHEDNTIWITGTSSDSIIKFTPKTEAWQIYPMPKRTTFSREVDFDKNGNVWISSNNNPGSHIENMAPAVIRLKP